MVRITLCYRVTVYRSQGRKKKTPHNRSSTIIIRLGYLKRRGKFPGLDLKHGGSKIPQSERWISEICHNQKYSLTPLPKLSLTPLGMSVPG